MLKKLQKKWRVGTLQLVLIITTFAIAGSLCGYTGRKLLGLITINNEFLWIVLYMLVISILWPLSIFLISIPLGQFSFFKRYLQNIITRFRGKIA